MSGHRLRLPRYQQPRELEYDAAVREVLVPGVRVLDVGSGRTPSIAPAARPAGCHYVGLDIAEDELRRAPRGSYDETFVADITTHVPALDAAFDLIVCWQVLEHVKPLDTAVENMRRYLRPGGRLVAYLSGAFSLFGLINQVVPAAVGVWAMHRLLGRAPDTVFPAHYHHCWHGALKRAFRAWQAAEVIPHYRGAEYFRFFGPLERTYLRYEEWTRRGNHQNLATHYLLIATR